MSVKGKIPLNRRAIAKCFPMPQRFWKGVRGKLFPKSFPRRLSDKLQFIVLNETPHITIIIPKKSPRGKTFSQKNTPKPLYSKGQRTQKHSLSLFLSVYIIFRNDPSNSHPQQSFFLFSWEQLRGNITNSSRTRRNNTQSLAFRCQDKRQAFRA